MSIQTINSLSQINSYSENSRKAFKPQVFKPKDLTYFQLDEDICVSAKEMEKLPDSYKNQITNVFSKVLKNKNVLNEIKNENASSIALKIKDNHLAYSLDGKDNNYTLNDERIEKSFEKVTRNVKRYLKNTKTIKDRKIVDLSIKDQNILKNRPSDIDKIKADEKALEKRYPKLVSLSLKYLKKFARADAEWSLWAIWLSDIHSSLLKVLNVFSAQLRFLDKIKGWDDWLGYLVGSLGLMNGITDVRDAKKIDDKEGKYDGLNKIIRNTFVLGADSIDWASKAIKTAGNVVLKFALSIIASSVFLFVTLYAMAKFIYFDVKALHFKMKLNEYLENDKLTQVERNIGALKFLKEKIMVSKRKSYKILKKIRKQNPNLSDDQIEKLTHEKIRRIVQTKVKRFERRVGENLAGVIQRNIKQILKDPKNDLNIKAINKIFEKIKYKNSISIHENTWYALAISLQGVELFLFIIMGFSLPALIPGALCSIIFAYLQGYSFYRSYYLKDDKKDKNDAQEIDENVSRISKAAI